jgi:hypothetical protein
MRVSITVPKAAGSVLVIGTVTISAQHAQEQGVTVAISAGNSVLQQMTVVESRRGRLPTFQSELMWVLTHSVISTARITTTNSLLTGHASTVKWMDFCVR